VILKKGIFTDSSKRFGWMGLIIKGSIIKGRDKAKGSLSPTPLILMSKRYMWGSSRIMSLMERASISEMMERSIRGIE